MALAGLCREADIGRGLEDMALEGLSCLDVPAAEPGLIISTKITEDPESKYSFSRLTSYIVISLHNIPTTLRYMYMYIKLR